MQTCENAMAVRGRWHLSSWCTSFSRGCSWGSRCLCMWCSLPAGPGSLFWTSWRQQAALQVRESAALSLCRGVSAGVSEGVRKPKPRSHAVYGMMVPAGIAMAAVADNQLFRFVKENERRLAAGKKPVLLLDTGEESDSSQPTSAMPSVCCADSCKTTLLIGQRLLAPCGFQASADCQPSALLLGPRALKGG